MSSKIFESSFLKNGLLEFRSKAIIVSMLEYSWNNNEVHYKNIILTRIVMTIFEKYYVNCNLGSSKN